MANCNLSGNGCKARGRVGGVAAERICPSYHTKTIVRVRVNFIFCVKNEEDLKSAVCRLLLYTYSVIILTSPFKEQIL